MWGPLPIVGEGAGEGPLKKIGSEGSTPDFDNRLPKGLLDRDRARILRRDQTDAEQKLWMKLRNRSTLGVKFRRQYPVRPYIADFCALEPGLIIELDGGQHGEMEESDQKRTHFLESLGYRVVGFWNNEVLGDMDSVLERIGDYL
jgi:very-short-patch-repair endonuclease